MRGIQINVLMQKHMHIWDGENLSLVTGQCFICVSQRIFLVSCNTNWVFCVGRIVSMTAIMTAIALMSPGKSLIVASLPFLPVILDHLYEDVTSCHHLPFPPGHVILCLHLHPWDFVDHPVHWEIRHHLIVAVPTMAYSVAAHHLLQQHHQTDSGDHHIIHICCSYQILFIIYTCSVVWDLHVIMNQLCFKGEWYLPWAVPCLCNSEEPHQKLICMSIIF